MVMEMPSLRYSLWRYSANGLFVHAVAVVEQVERQLLAILGAHLVAAQYPACFVKDLRRSLRAVLIRLQADIAVGEPWWRKAYPQAAPDRRKYHQRWSDGR